jgi:hypothetical protein
MPSLCTSTLLVLTLLLTLTQPSIQAKKARKESPIIGQFHLPAHGDACLELEDSPRGQYISLSINDCESGSTSQQWRLDPTKMQIMTSPGNKCLGIHSENRSSRSDNNNGLVDKFTHRVVEVMPCKYINTGRSSTKGQADGWQKLVFVNDTIIWRGQSKTLPADVRDRYCVEVVEYERTGDEYLSLEKCVPGKEQQRFHFEDKDSGERKQ